MTFKNPLQLILELHELHLFKNFMKQCYEYTDKNAKDLSRAFVNCVTKVTKYQKHCLEVDLFIGLRI